MNKVSVPPTIQRCACGAEPMVFQMPAIVRADTIHMPDGCETFDQPAYVRYLMTFERPEADALNAIQWHRLQKMGPR